MTGLIDLKAQLNITDDTDDALLEALFYDAVDHTREVVGFPFAYQSGALRRAVLMLAAHWYENREAVAVGISAQAMPLGYEDLIAPHRKWVF